MLMLRELELRAFRRHLHRTFTFTPGLNVLRGLNESGKSTILEGILYAAFGSSMLRQSLDETVTWEHKPSELGVRLTMSDGTNEVVFNRSQAGAEVLKNGKVFVTGQKEVSAYAATIFKADGKMVQRLMFANQNTLRGALEQGPKAVTVMIEELCSFDIFDQVMAKMEQHLVLGSPSTLESKLRDAQDRLLCYVEPVAPDMASLLAEKERMEQHLVQLQGQVAAAEAAAAAASTAVLSAEGAQRMHQTCVTALRRHEDDLKLHVEQLNAAQAKQAKAPSQEEIDAAKRQLREASDHSRQLAAYRALRNLRYPEIFWEGDKAGLEAEVDRLQASIKANQAERSKVQQEATKEQSEARLLSSRLITNLTCPTCGQDIKNKEAVTAQNQKLEAEIAARKADGEALLSKVAGFDQVIKDLEGDLATLVQLRRSAAPFEEFATANGQYVAVDCQFVPPKLTWVGDAPNDQPIDIQGIKDRIATLEESQDTARRAAGQAEALSQAILDDRGAIERARDNLTKYPEVPNLDGLQRAARERADDVAALKHQEYAVREKLSALATRMATAQREYELEVVRGNELKAEAARIEAELKKLAFNNALLRKIRAIRPLVADKLWNQVLAAVSVMFTQMRGERSVVTKGSDGFYVNGKGTSGLSGSTLDVLGLAIRNALVKTFLPECGLVVLDEPAQGCDEERTLSLLGFIAAAGFEQTLLVTHESVSETYAANLITL